MSIAYRAAPRLPAVSLAVMIPATVQEGDYVVLAAGFLSATATADTVTGSSAGTVPPPLSATVYIGGPQYGNARLFGFTAGASW